MPELGRSSASRRWRAAGAITAALAVCAAGAVWIEAPVIGAGGLLHPSRHKTVVAPPDRCADATFDGAGITLRGWRCTTAVPRRGTIVYLHGVADNRGSASGIIQRFLQRGFDVVAYDSRAHGDSGGDACTYGFFEKQDLRRVVDTVAGPILLIGSSLGGAVALQEAADDPRVRAVVAAETFSDLRTVATDRASGYFPGPIIDRAFAVAEMQGQFHVDAVSPERAASRITAPVLLIHGDADVDTPPAHSERVYAALRGPKRLILVPGARHNGSLTPPVWREVENWLDQVIPKS